MATPFRRCADNSGFSSHCVADLDNPHVCTKCGVPMPDVVDSGLRDAQARIDAFEATRMKPRARDAFERLPNRCRFDCPEPCPVHPFKKDRTIEGLAARVQFLETKVAQLLNAAPDDRAGYLEEQLRDQLSRAAALLAGVRDIGSAPPQLGLDINTFLANYAAFETLHSDG